MQTLAGAVQTAAGAVQTPAEAVQTAAEAVQTGGLALRAAMTSKLLRISDARWEGGRSLSGRRGEIVSCTGGYVAGQGCCSGVQGDPAWLRSDSR